MTEDRKPAKPGMEEVSPKFVDEAEAAVEAAASTDEALSALWQEWQRLCEANDKAVEDEDKAKLAKEAITDHETPEYRAAAAEFEAAQERPEETFAALMAVEGRIENTPARSVKGAAIKLRMAKYLIDIEHPDGPSDEAEMSREDSLTLSVLADLERMPDVVSPQRSPIFSQIFNMETPITDAEGAVKALERLVAGGDLAGIAEAIIYLVSQLRQHIEEERRLFRKLFIAAGGDQREG